jgi:HSP20 family molecular chaperone IbpA
MNRLISANSLLAPSFNRLLDHAFGAFAPLSPDGRSRETVEQTEEAHVLRIDLPGLRKEDIQLDLNDRTLTVAAESPADRPFATRYRRAWSLGPEIDTARISARLDLGVLEVTLPKLTPATPATRTIEIQTA